MSLAIQVEESQALLLWEFIQDQRLEKKTKKPSLSPIKVLYAIFQGHKYCQNHGYDEMYYSVRRIAQIARVSERSVQMVTGSRIFPEFCEKIEREYQTNIYRLKGWVIDLFHFLEKKGFMCNFVAAFKSWRKAFTKRFGALVRKISFGQPVNKIMNIHPPAKQEVVNKFSTKNESILHPLPPTILHPMKSSQREEPMKPRRGETMMNTHARDPSFLQYGNALEGCYAILRDDFRFTEDKLRVAKDSFTLNELQKAIMLMSLNGRVQENVRRI